MKWWLEITAVVLAIILLAAVSYVLRIQSTPLLYLYFAVGVLPDLNVSRIAFLAVMPIIFVIWWLAVARWIPSDAALMKNSFYALVFLSILWAIFGIIHALNYPDAWIVLVVLPFTFVPPVLVFAVFRFSHDWRSKIRSYVLNLIVFLWLVGTAFPWYYDYDL